MKILVILIFNLLSSNIHAATFKCGLYTLQGVVRETPDDFEVVINEKTASEIKVSVTGIDLVKLASYKDKSIQAEIVLTENQYGHDLTVKEISNIKVRIGNPLNPKDTFIKLVSPKNCQVKK